MDQKIPRKIWVIWLSDAEKLPELIEKCVRSQAKFAMRHDYALELINLETLPAFFEKMPRYLQECIDAKRWAKAVDYARAYILHQQGGIYLDADVEIPDDSKGFDDLLHLPMFVSTEENGFISNAVIGSEPGHEILKDFLGKVDRNFIGSGDLVFQPGMYLWTEIVRYSARVEIFAPEYFLPYNHHTDTLKVTENTRTIHHFSKSWLKTNV